MTAAEARSQARHVVLGPQRYVVDQAALQFPAHSPKGFVSQIAVNSRGEIYLVNRGDPVVQVFDCVGRWLAEWRTPVLSHGHGIHIDRHDGVWIVDSDRHCVHAFDAVGEHRLTLGRPDWPTYGAPFNHPTDVAVARNGDIYVSDGYGNSHVHRFSAAGEHLATWGGSGSGPREFSNPHSLCITRDDVLLVVDRENDRVQRYSPQGELLGTFCELHKPTEICEDRDGVIHVTDLTPRVSAYAPTGALLGRCRTFGAIGHGIAADPGGDLWIADMMPNTLSRFRRQPAP